MKVYIYPSNDKLIAVSPVDEAVIGEWEIQSTDPDDLIAMDVLPFRNELKKVVVDGVDYLWVPEPYEHPELQALLDRIAQDPDDVLGQEPDCHDCVHAEVCAAAIALRQVGATLATCDHFVALNGDDDDE